MSHPRRPAVVVDLAEYRRRRIREDLPLFAVSPAPPPRPGRRDAAAAMDARAVSHRQRMLRFLTGR